MKWQNLISDEAMDWNFLPKDEMQLLMDKMGAKYLKGINFSCYENEFISEHENSIMLHFCLRNESRDILYVSISELGDIYTEKETDYSTTYKKYEITTKEEFDEILVDIFTEFPYTTK